MKSVSVQLSEIEFKCFHYNLITTSLGKLSMGQSDGIQRAGKVGSPVTSAHLLRGSGQSRDSGSGFLITLLLVYVKRDVNVRYFLKIYCLSSHNRHKLIGVSIENVAVMRSQVESLEIIRCVIYEDNFGCTVYDGGFFKFREQYN